MPGPDARNLANALQCVLPPDGVETLARAATACDREGAALYLVGGSVRDALVGRADPLTDLDLVFTGGDASTGTSIAVGIGEVVSRSEFMTLKIKCGGLFIDLVRARSETYASSGALPEVRPSSLIEDLARRDFTINAMAVSLDVRRWGELIDPHGGLKDVERGVVRVLHDRSFEDDPTRMFRAVRYADRLGFKLAPGTRASLKKGLTHIDALSSDRVRHELERIFAEPMALTTLTRAREEGILEAVHPALAKTPAALERIKDSVLPVGESRGAILLAALVWGTSTGERLAIRDRLRLGARWSRVMSEVGELHDASEDLSTDSIAPSRIRERLAGFADATLEAGALLTTQENLRRAIRLYLDRLRHVRPILSGRDLIALGATEGSQIGRLLEELRDVRLDGMIEKRRDEERWVLNRLEKQGR